LRILKAGNSGYLIYKGVLSAEGLLVRSCAWALPQMPKKATASVKKYFIIIKVVFNPTKGKG